RGRGRLSGRAIGAHGHGPDAPGERRGDHGARLRHSVSIKFMWPDLSLPERARRAAAHGFTDVELWDWRGEDVDGLAEVCRETGIAIAGFFGHSHAGLIDPAQRDTLLGLVAETVHAAERVGARQPHMSSDG